MGIQQKLHTKLVQKLILTPSLQQAIKLLPMSTLELSDLLNQEMVENPMLEEVPTEELQPAEAAPTPEKPEVDPQANKTLPGQTRLYMNIGSEMGVGPRDIAGTIMGQTGLPPEAVGTIDIRERHLFANVSSEHANSIIAKLNRSSIREHKLKVKIA